MLSAFRVFLCVCNVQECLGALLGMTPQGVALSCHTLRVLTLFVTYTVRASEGESVNGR